MKIKKILSKNKTIATTYMWLMKKYYEMLTIISPKLNTKAMYKRLFKKELNLAAPVTLNEKILKLKLDRYETDPLIRQCADKYAVRRYIEDKGCSEILVPLIAAYDSPEEIEWGALPESFVIKWNFGCGFNIICPDKSKLSKEEAIAKLKKWRKIKYHLHHSEMQYKDVDKKIIVEEYLKPSKGTLPEDYKVYCFNGKAMFVMMCVGRDYGHPKFLYFDEKFNFCKEFSADGMEYPVGNIPEKPDGYDDLFKYADILSEPFEFVRADFYIIDGKVYFGELTFTPSGALDAKRLPEIDKYFGSLLNI